MSLKNLHNPFINSYFAAQNKYIGIYGQNREDTRDQREELFSMDFSHVVPRREEHEINLDSRLAQIVIGVRRCGKSTLCQKVLLQGNVRFAYVNFDDETLASLHASQLNDILG